MTGSGVNEESALLRAVVATPDDDTPRLVYADWLDEHGRAERAELIRLQCQITHLQSRERELLDAHAREWGRILAALGVARWTFHRGFPEDLSVSAGRFLMYHKEINEITPVRHLRLGRTDDATLATLAALPAMEQLRSLDVGQTENTPLPREFGTDGLRAVAASGHLWRLEQLILRSHGIGAAGARILAASPYLSRLTHLTLDDPAFNRVGETDRGGETVGLLASAPGLAALRELKLGRTVYGPHLIRRWREPAGPSQTDGRAP